MFYPFLVSIKHITHDTKQNDCDNHGKKGREDQQELNKKKEEGRRKKEEEGRRKKEEGKRKTQTLRTRG